MIKEILLTAVLPLVLDLIQIATGAYLLSFIVSGESLTLLVCGIYLIVRGASD